MWGEVEPDGCQAENERDIAVQPVVGEEKAEDKGVNRQGECIEAQIKQ